MLKENLEMLKGKVREIARARRQEEVEATKYVLDTIIAGDIWLDPNYRANLAQLSTALPRPQREALYEESRKKDSLSTAAMNLIPVLGLGSWKQRDAVGAVLINLSGIMGVLPLVPALGLHPVIACLAIAAGSSFFYHANGSHFWVVVKINDLSMKEGYALVSFGSALGSIAGMVVVFIMSLFLKAS